MELLKKTFRPEFLNRIDETVLFNSLDESTIDKIVVKFLNLAKARMNDKGIEFTYDDKAISYIHEQAYDFVYGARPISNKDHLR